MYVTLSAFRNKTKVHVCKFVLLPSLFNKNWTYLSATKDCVFIAYSSPDFKDGLTCCVKGVNISTSSGISIGQDMFLSYRDWLGEMKTFVHQSSGVDLCVIWHEAIPGRNAEWRQMETTGPFLL